MNRLALFNVSADIITIFIAFIAIIAGQKTSTTFGFAAGIFSGLVSGNMGLSMLSRTIEGLVAGYFHISEDNHPTTRQINTRFFSATVISGFCANAVMDTGYNPLGLPFLHRIVVLGLAESFFTLILAVILHWLFLKKALVN